VRSVVVVCGWILRAVLAANLLGGVAMASPVGAALERPALAMPDASKAVLQAAAVAGRRLVAVGERGIVVVSDDQGQGWRQVPVPVSVGLTAIQFVDARHGWIVGHGGTVLASADGGLSWQRQLDGRQAAEIVRDEARQSGDARAIALADRLVADGPDKPFLDLAFFDERHGLVIGAYNLALETTDGGKTWQSISSRLDNPKGLHLYAIRARGAELVIAGEQGLLLRSTDGGRSFTRLQSPYKGSFFTVALPGKASIVVAGMRGSVWRSDDDGANWSAVRLPVPVSITASALDAQGQVWLASQAGDLYRVQGDAVVAAAAAGPPLNGLLLLPERAIGLSLAGIVQLSLAAATAQAPASGVPGVHE
jgi:photosystem II stability/assembly factor-like uncharacterized protein